MNNREVEALCGIPKDWNFMWVIDEFDSSFNTLAMASLRYHMNHSVAVCAGKQRATFQSPLDRFEEAQHRDTSPHGYMDHFSQHREGVIELLRLKCPECKEFQAQKDEARQKRKADINKLRHEFVNILPWLWS